MMYGWAACHKCQNWLPSVAIKLSLSGEVKYQWYLVPICCGTLRS